MGKIITVPKPGRVDFDDSFYGEAIAEHKPVATYLAQHSPAPPEMVQAVKEKFRVQVPSYSVNPYTPLTEDPLHQWAVGKAALAHQMNWYVQTTGNQIITVADYYGPDSGIQSLFPAFVESEIQHGLIAEGLVSWLTFGTVQVDSTTVRDIYDSSAEDTRSLRQTGPGGELPRVKFTFADSDVNLYKYGRVLEMAYEVIKNQKVDMLAHRLQLIGMQMAVDETDSAIHTLVNGDGTTAGSAESDTTDVDVAAAASIAYSDLVSWVYNPSNPYTIDKAVGGKTDLALVTNLSEFKDRSKLAEIAPDLPTPLRVQYRRWDGGVTGSAYVDRLIVGIDSRLALKRYVDGSLLQETDNVISRGVKEWALSYNVGWRKFDAAATHVLDCNAAL